MTPQALETRRREVRDLKERMAAESAASARRDREWQSKDPEYQRYWADPRFQSLDRRCKLVGRLFAERRRKFEGRIWEEYSEAERDEIRALDARAERLQQVLWRRIARVRQDYRLPSGPPLDIPERLGREVSEKWLIARMAAGAYEGSVTEAAIGVLRRYEPKVYEMIGKAHVEHMPKDPVRAVEYLISLLLKPGTPKLSGPEPTPRESEAITALRTHGLRMTGKQLSERAWGSQGPNKGLLAQMVSKQLLTNGKDERGQGYGLPEWNA